MAFEEDDLIRSGKFNYEVYECLARDVRKSVLSGVLANSTSSKKYDCLCVQATVNSVQKKLLKKKVLEHSLRPLGVHPIFAVFGINLSDNLLMDAYLRPIARSIDSEVNKLRGELLSEFAVVQLGSKYCGISHDEMDIIVYASMISALLDRGFLGLNESHYIDRCCKECIQYNGELKQMLFSNRILRKKKSIIEILDKIRNTLNKIKRAMKTNELKIVDEIFYRSVIDSNCVFRILRADRILGISAATIETGVRHPHSKLCVYKAFINNVVKAIASREKKTAGSQFILEKK